MQTIDLLPKKIKKINYLDGFYWHWDTDPADLIHCNYLIDFVDKNNNRFVLIQMGCLFVHGVMGDRCDKALSNFKLALSGYRSCAYGFSVMESEVIEFDIPNLRLYKNDNPEDDSYFKQLWDVDRSYWDKDKPIIYGTKCRIKSHLKICGQHIEDEFRSKILEQGNLFEDLDLFTEGIRKERHHEVPRPEGVPGEC